ncbi:MAG: sigma-70 family RNA polymerase sigma factor [Ferruginibacter sp.]|nr:sigma-70 family RNA polymerase sigma factor [Ferruginibacter sp.]
MNTKQFATLTDGQLINLFTEGSVDAMNELVNRHKSRIYTSIYAMVKDKYLAEDIFQDLFIKLIETIRAKKYNDENKFVFWAMRIAHNLCIDHFRKIKAGPVTISTDDAYLLDILNFSEPSAEEKIVKAQSCSKIMNLVSLLPEDQREVVMLRHFGNLKFKQISNILNCSVNTALGRMRYALTNLRKMNEEREPVL